MSSRPREVWRLESACQGNDLFTLDPPNMVELRAAVTICNGCPVRAHCAELAESIRPTWGIWSGRWWRPVPGRATGRPAP